MLLGVSLRWTEESEPEEEDEPEPELKEEGSALEMRNLFFLEPPPKRDGMNFMACLEMQMQDAKCR